MDNTNPIRTRFAPSPTGFLHIGGLRTALYNYLFAKKHGGTFILRVEDTDQQRFVEGALEGLLDILSWSGISPDEGPYRDPDSNTIQEKGAHGPYIQSRRRAMYADAAQDLVSRGAAYYCFCTPQRLEEMRQWQIATKKPPMYDRTCRSISPDEARRRAESGEACVVRLAMPQSGVTTWDDCVRGTVTFDNATVDDVVLLKSDGFPTYHLANVVDDHAMAITHVIRGEEWISSTPRHCALYAAFGWTPPQFAHIPLLLNPDRTKLSKRQGDVAAEDYRSKGYLPEALINFVALLGWHPGKGVTQEFFTVEELIAHFDLSHVHKAGAVVDPQKISFINAHYLRAMPIETLSTAVRPYLEKLPFYGDMPQERVGNDYIMRVLTVERDRMTTLADCGRDSAYFFIEPTVDPQLLAWKDMDTTAVENSLVAAKTCLTSLPSDPSREDLRAAFLVAAEKFPQRGMFFWPLRVALTGARQSPPPEDVAWVIGIPTAITRIDAAIKSLVI